MIRPRVRMRVVVWSLASASYALVLLQPGYEKGLVSPVTATVVAMLTAFGLTAWFLVGIALAERCCMKLNKAFTLRERLSLATGQGVILVAILGSILVTPNILTVLGFPNLFSLLAVRGNGSMLCNISHQLITWGSWHTATSLIVVMACPFWELAIGTFDHSIRHSMA